MRHLFLLLLPLARPVVAQVTPLPASPHTILVRGTAEQELEPEKLDLLLTYRFSDNVKENGRTQEQEQALHQLLKQVGVGPEKLVLEDLSASGYGGFSKTANTSVALTKVYRLSLDNPKILNDLIPRLVQNGADHVRFVNLQNARIAATKAELVAQAVADARQKAEAAAKATGQKLGAALALAEVVPGSSRAEWPSSRYKYLAMGSRSSAGTTEEEEETSLRKIVIKVGYDVVFEIK